MRFSYPLDVEAVRRHVDARRLGPPLGLDGDSRDDLVLTTLVWELGHGWFPLDSGFAFHGAVDIGLPDVGGFESFIGTAVRAIADGEVLDTQAPQSVAEGYVFGRVVIRHQTKNGETFYSLYQHLDDVKVAFGSHVKAGEEIGLVGWHGDFPHLHFAVASETAIGGAEDLVPECDARDIPVGDGTSNILRVKVESLDMNEWAGAPAGPMYLYNPIEFVRFNLGLPYEHDIGVGSPHKARLQSGGSVCSLRKGEENHHDLGTTVLKSEILRASAKLEAMAHDLRFTPIGKGHGDKEVVMTLQRAFKVAGFHLGKSGPEKDGIDGDFGRTTETVVKTFQKRVREETPEDVSFPLPEAHGEIDCASLLALDRLILAHRKSHLSALPKVEGRAPQSTTPPPPPVEYEPDGDAFVFDGMSRRTSLVFGMKMYEALLRWELKQDDATGAWEGIKFSGVGEPYTRLYKDWNEWPDMSFLVAPTSQVECGERNVNVFRAFGVNWRGTGYTNCCNAMLAALFVALGGKQLSRRRTDGSVDTMMLSRRYNVPSYDKNGNSIPGTSQDLILAFEQRVMNLAVPANLFNSRGDRLRKETGATTNGLILLEIGKEISPFTTDPVDRLKHLHIGDVANRPPHSFLIGDVRYGLWLEGTEDVVPDFVLDQSSFTRSAEGELHKVKKVDAKGKPIRNAATRVKCLKLDANGCRWIIDNEVEFQRRVSAFVDSTSLEYEGQRLTIQKKEVLKWQEFTANCLHARKGKEPNQRRTIHGRVYDGADEEADLLDWTHKGPIAPEDSGKWQYQEQRTADEAGLLGISRKWNDKTSDLLSWGRFYENHASTEAAHSAQLDG